MNVEDIYTEIEICKNTYYKYLNEIEVNYIVSGV
jgi:hypothetical protein